METIPTTVLLIVIVLLILVILFLFLKKTKLSAVPPVETVKGRINVKEGIDKQKVFVDNQYKYINTALQQNYPATPFVPDNREAWFDLENLKAYIAYVERESAKQGLKNLGLRVYSAATIDDGVPRSTYFFWPTNNNGTPKSNRHQKSAMPPGDDGGNSNSDGIDGLNYGQSGRPPAGFP